MRTKHYVTTFEVPRGDKKVGGQVEKILISHACLSRFCWEGTKRGRHKKKSRRIKLVVNSNSSKLSDEKKCERLWRAEGSKHDGTHKKIDRYAINMPPNEEIFKRSHWRHRIFSLTFLIVVGREFSYAWKGPTIADCNDDDFPRGWFFFSGKLKFRFRGFVSRSTQNYRNNESINQISSPN